MANCSSCPYGSSYDRLIQAVEDLHDVKLEDQLMQFENENEKLRKELEFVGHIAVSNVAASIGREESLEAENAKLRELASDAHSCKTNDGCCEDCYCDEGCCPVERRMQELGIEVD